MFAPALTFLDELAQNNNKPWFEANRKRYERDVKEPAVALVTALAPRLAALSPHLRAVATGTGSSVSRIHRDTRFSTDKSPYKNYVGMHFTHSAGKEAPGLHLHISRGDCGVGLGVWMLEPPELLKVRTRISEGRDWAGVRAALDASGFRFIGEALKRVPRGFPADHPHAAHLCRKTFGVGRSVDVTLPQDQLVDAVTAAWRAGWPLMQFTCAALGVPL